MTRILTASLCLTLTLVAAFAAGAVAFTQLSTLLPENEPDAASPSKRPTTEGVFVVAVASQGDEIGAPPALPADFERLLILVCDSARSGATVASALRESGYARVTVVDGAATRKSIRGGRDREADDASMPGSCARWRPFGYGA